MLVSSTILLVAPMVCDNHSRSAIMKNRPKCIFGLSALFLLQIAVAESKQQRADELLTRAAQEGTLDPTSGNPYRVQYRFKVTAFGSVNVPGTFLRVWSGSGRWRQEISVPGYSGTIVVNGNKKWILRNTVAEPNVFSSLEWGLQPKLQWEPDEVAHAVRSERHGAQRFHCIERGPKNGGWRTLCFDDATGKLTTLTNNGMSFEYSDWRQIDSRLVAGHVKMLGHEHQEVDAELVSLEQPSAADTEFSKPTGGEEWAYCEHQSPPILTARSEPDFGLATLRGGVEVYGVIETDGHISHATIVSGSGKEFEKPALAAFSRWRFRPAMCDGVPIRTETRITFRVTSYRP
jgi:TonB family protein